MIEGDDKGEDGAAVPPPDGNAADPPGVPPSDPPAAEAAPAPPPTPEERIAALEKEKQETRDRMLRIAADFENWKKRARKEQTEAEVKAREQVLRDMLEVVDNLERAMTAFGDEADTASVLRGVNLVLRLFQSKLDRWDVKPVEAKGKPFDPRLHEAISQVPTTEEAPGTVVAEMQKGYRVGDRLLRAAVVAVAAPPRAEEPAIEVEAEEEAKGSGAGGDGAKPDSGDA